MACNCGKGRKASKYEYTAPDGKKSVFRTEIEAQAMQIRNKGGSYRAITG